MLPTSVRAHLAIAAVALMSSALVLVVAAPASAVPAGGTISGTITLASAGEDPSGFTIEFSPRNGVILPLPTVTPAPDGTFSILLPEDDYIVQAIPTTDALKAVYPALYYPGSLVQDGASYVSVTDGVTTPFAFAPSPGGFIAADIAFNGTVTDPGIRFDLFDQTGTVSVSGPRGARATFPGSTLGGWEPGSPVAIVGPLPAGSYRLAVTALSSDGGGVTEWATQYWNHVLSLKSGWIATVRTGETTTGVEFDLDTAPTGAISGRVTDGTGAPIEGAYVSAESSTGVLSVRGAKGVRTDARGNYTIPYLAPGDYTVFAWQFSPGTLDVTQYTYYPASATYDGATPVTVTTGPQSIATIELGSPRTPINQSLLYKFQYQILPPASQTADLLSLLDNRGVAVEEASDWGAEDEVAVNEEIELDDVPWTDPDDLSVDVFGYSTAQYLGTLAVSAGSVSGSLAASSFAAGNHHLVLVGSSSGGLKAATITVTAMAGTAALPDTGVSTSPIPLAVALLLLLAGAGFLSADRLLRKV